MERKVFLILAVVVCCVAAVNSSEDVQERRKRDIWDGIKNWFQDAGTKISDVAKQIGSFTSEKFNEFKESLKNRSKSDLEKTYEGLKKYYDDLGDRTTAEAQRVQETLDELKKDIDASGSSTTRFSLLAGSSTTRFSLLAGLVLVLVSIFVI